MTYPTRTLMCTFASLLTSVVMLAASMSAAV